MRLHSHQQALRTQVQERQRRLEMHSDPLCYAWVASECRRAMLVSNAAAQIEIRSETEEHAADATLHLPLRHWPQE